MILPDILYWSIYIAYLLFAVLIVPIYKKIGLVIIPLFIIFTGFYWSMHPESAANKPAAASVATAEPFQAVTTLPWIDGLLAFVMIGGCIFFLWRLKYR